MHFKAATLLPSFPLPRSGETPRDGHRLLTNNLGRPKGGILVRHSSSQRSLHLRTEGQFAQIIALFRRGLVSLLLEALVFKAVEAGGPFFDFLQAGVGAVVVVVVTVVVVTVGGGGEGVGDGGGGREGVRVGGDEGGVGGVAFGGALRRNLRIGISMD